MQSRITYEKNRKSTKDMNENLFNKKTTLNMAAFLIATAGTLCFPQILNLKDNTLVFSNSIFAVFLWLLCLYGVRSSLNTIDLYDKRGWVAAGIFSFLFTCAMLFGVRLDSTGSVDFKDWHVWGSLPVLTCLFTVFVRRLWSFLCRLSPCSTKTDIDEPLLPKKLSTMMSGHRNILTFLFLLLCWLPVLLAVYPGFFVYDAQDEWVQVASRTFNTHHPLVHVLLLGGIICAVHKVTDSYNLGIACYTILQMSVVSGGFTFLLAYMRRQKVSRTIRIISLLYFAFFPVIVMFALCSAKDTLFTTTLLMLLLSLLDMGICRETFFLSRKKMLFFVICTTAMMLFRKNGIYAFVLLIPFLLIYHKKYFKKLLILILAALFSYFFINSGLTTLFHAGNVEKQEILTVPIQQLARTYKFNKDVFDDEEINTLHEVLPEEALSLYNPRLSDPVKAHFQNDTYMADRFKYIRLWLRIGMKKPLSYLNAWLVNSYGFWYPDTVVNVYSGNTVFTFTYGDCSYFGYEVERPGVRDSKIPWLDEIYRKLSLEISKENIPIYSMMYSMGGLFWFFAFTFFYVVYRKKYHLAIPCLMVLFVWITVIIGPTYLPRYMLIFWYGLPLFAAMLSSEF